MTGGATSHESAWAGGVAIAFLLLNTTLLAAVDLLPFIDLPNHLAEATIYKYWGPNHRFSDYYVPTPWYFPNTFHTVFCSLFPSVETGNKVFHILYLLLLQGAMFFVVRHVKGNQWYGLLTILFTYNFNLTFGFVGFAISLPTLILLFYATLLYTANENAYLNIIIAFLLVMLFFMHAQNALFGLVLYGFMMLYHFRKSFRKLIVHCLLIPIPLVILIVTWWFTRAPQEDSNTTDYLIQYYTTEYFPHFFERLRIAILDNFQLRAGRAGTLIAAGFFMCLIVPLFLAKPWKSRLQKHRPSPEMIYAIIFFLTALGCFLLAPSELPGQSPIYHRFCTIVILAGIIPGSMLMRHVYSSWLRGLSVIAIFVYVVMWTEHIYTFNAQNKGFNKTLFTELDPEKTLAALIYDNAYRGRKVYIHFQNYFLIWNQGIVASKIIDYRFGVVRRAPSGKPIPFYNELIGDQYQYQPQYAEIDYLLVRGKAPVESDHNLHSFTRLKSVHAWSVFYNRQRP